MYCTFMRKLFAKFQYIVLEEWACKVQSQPWICLSLCGTNGIEAVILLLSAGLLAHYTKLMQPSHLGLRAIK